MRLAHPDLRVVRGRDQIDSPEARFESQAKGPRGSSRHRALLHDPLDLPAETDKGRAASPAGQEDAAARSNFHDVATADQFGGHSGAEVCLEDPCVALRHESTNVQVLLRTIG